MKQRERILLPLLVSLTLAASCKRDEPDVITEPALVGTPYTLQIPANLPPMSVPADNPMTVEGVTLVGTAGDALQTTRSAGVCVRLQGAAVASCRRVNRAGAAPQVVCDTT